MKEELVIKANHSAAQGTVMRPVFIQQCYLRHDAKTKSIECVCKDQVVGQLVLVALVHVAWHKGLMVVNNSR